MKKKPEVSSIVAATTGNTKPSSSRLSLKHFLKNLKENDLHYENKQITQCVFLGVLRLKPVPSVFSNNTPPPSTHQIKNNNSTKIFNKNVQKKVVANRKRVEKKPTNNFKLSSKKKALKMNAAPKSSQIFVTATTTKLNPVEVLFEKMKQSQSALQDNTNQVTITTKNPLDIVEIFPIKSDDEDDDDNASKTNETTDVNLVDEEDIVVISVEKPTQKILDDEDDVVVVGSSKTSNSKKLEILSDGDDDVICVPSPSPRKELAPTQSKRKEEQQTSFTAAKKFAAVVEKSAKTYLKPPTRPSLLDSKKTKKPKDSNIIPRKLTRAQLKYILEQSNKKKSNVNKYQHEEKRDKVVVEVKEEEDDVLEVPVTSTNLNEAPQISISEKVQTSQPEVVKSRPRKHSILDKSAVQFFEQPVQKLTRLQLKYLCEGKSDEQTRKQNAKPRKRSILERSSTMYYKPTPSKEHKVSEIGSVNKFREIPTVNLDEETEEQVKEKQNFRKSASPDYPTIILEEEQTKSDAKEQRNASENNCQIINLDEEKDVSKKPSLRNTTKAQTPHQRISILTGRKSSPKEQKSASEACPIINLDEDKPNQRNSTPQTGRKPAVKEQNPTEVCPIINLDEDKPNQRKAQTPPQTISIPSARKLATKQQSSASETSAIINLVEDKPNLRSSIPKAHPTINLEESEEASPTVLPSSKVEPPSKNLRKTKANLSDSTAKNILTVPSKSLVTTPEKTALKEERGKSSSTRKPKPSVDVPVINLEEEIVEPNKKKVQTSTVEKSDQAIQDINCINLDEIDEKIQDIEAPKKKTDCTKSLLHSKRISSPPICDKPKPTKAQTISTISPPTAIQVEEIKSNLRSGKSPVVEGEASQKPSRKSKTLELNKDEEKETSTNGKKRKSASPAGGRSKKTTVAKKVTRKTVVEKPDDNAEDKQRRDSIEVQLAILMGEEAGPILEKQSEETLQNQDAKPVETAVELRETRATRSQVTPHQMKPPETTPKNRRTISKPHKNQTKKTTKTPSNKSPSKQRTLVDMFKDQMKKEVVEPSSIEDDLTASKENKSEALVEDEDVEALLNSKIAGDVVEHPQEEHDEENNYYDDDSDDSGSKAEWMPEDYAEYKFKYSAKKLCKTEHKCKICLLVLPSYYRLNKHRLEHTREENPYNCVHCDKSFGILEELTAHIRIHRGKHPYTCKKCSKGFWSKKSLETHLPIHVLRKAKPPNKRFRCDVCAKEFSKLCDMERHTRVHTGEKPCVCNICHKRFQQSHNLSKHLLTHLHVKPYHCEICNKQFGRNDVLNRHILTHSVEKPFKCSSCPKGFIRQTQLDQHTAKHHPSSK